MSRWKRFKCYVRQVLHPYADFQSGVRIGRMLERQEAQKPLPPIFGERPVYFPVYISVPPEAYHQRLQERRRLSQHSTAMIRKTILQSLADEPPPDGETLHETPAWIR